MSIEDVLSNQPFLVVEVDGVQYRRVLYSTDWFALMHAAERTDLWLLKALGYVPRDRTWWVQPPKAG